MTALTIRAASSPAPEPIPSLHPTDMPEVYAMICDGDCMEPYFQHGQKLLFSKTERWEAGDPVVLFRRPQTLKPGESQVLFKQLLSAPAFDYWHRQSPFSRGNVRPMVMVRMLNPERTLCFAADSLLGIHKFIGHMDRHV